MRKSQRLQIGKETIEIVQQGGYELKSGNRVVIKDQVSESIKQTVLYTPEELDQLVESIQPQKQVETRFEVQNETTLEAARRMVVDHKQQKVLCLNFASAKNPGGGFQRGTQAQEESLARSSALYDSLISQWDYYEVNRQCKTSLYTDLMILTPEVPVFRKDDGQLLTEPYQVSILTSPAVNAGAVLKNEPNKQHLIRPTMSARIEKVLAIAASENYEHLILGAWGCGVFRNDPREIAELFANALLRDSRFCTQFKSVTFAVLDGTDDLRIINPFKQHFGRGEDDD
ncbi:MAG: TIGR02452 family protein [Blastopirellula sp.]|nr:MAG: TIGR02452 family protein [Blastopirellula sp.]